MLKKIIILIVFAIAVAFVADFYGIIDLPSYEGKPKIFKNRDDLLYKSQKKINSEVK